MHGHSAEPDWSVKYRTTHPKLKQQKPTHDDVSKTSSCPTTTIKPQQLKQNENKMVDMAQMELDKTWDGCETE